MTEQTTFWKPQPREPWSDWRTYSLLVPILFSAVGACIFTTLAFSFTEVDGLPKSFLTNLVIVGAFTVGIGSTFGSVASGIEIFRKQASGAVGTWDWIALGISTSATVGGYALGFAALLGAMAQWSNAAQVWGPLVLGTLVSLDGLGDIVELGGLFGSYELRMETWLHDREAWRREQGIVVEKPVVQPDPDWRPARIGDFRRLLGRLNGGSADLTAEQLELELAREQLNLPSETTVNRWLNIAHEKGQ